MEEQNTIEEQQRVETNMTLQIQEKSLKLKYQTNIFQYTFEIEGSRSNRVTRDWERYKEKRNTPLQAIIELGLSERGALPDMAGTAKKAKPVWYNVSIAHFNDLDSGGAYQYPGANPNYLDISTIPYNQKNLAPEIERMVKQAFPLHNVVLKIDIHSAIEQSFKDEDYKDLRAPLRPLVKELTTYLIEQGLTKL